MVLLLDFCQSALLYIADAKLRQRQTGVKRVTWVRMIRVECA